MDHQNALAYYWEQLLLTSEKIKSQKIIALMKPLDTVFVVMRRQIMAKDVIKYETNEKLTAEEFSIKFAPPVDGENNYVLLCFRVF